MPPARSSTQTRATRQRRALVSALDAAETKRLLAALLDAHPELVEEAVAPFIEDLARRTELGRRAEAVALCQGTLLGLYRLSQEEEEFLDGHAPDSLEDAAALALATWKKSGKGRARTGTRAKEWEAMRSFVSDALPEWRSFLTRTLGRIPTRDRREVTRR